MSKAHKIQGFTLVEMLMVVVMLAAVGSAIVATFSGGLKIFDRVQNYTAVKADILLAMERMERDLRNTFPLQGIDFAGEAKRMTFPAILKTYSDKDPMMESLGSVSYYREDGDGESSLAREEKTYPEAVQKENTRHGHVAALAPVEDIRFQYFSYAPEEGTYSWGSTWDVSQERKDREEEGKAVRGAGPLEERFEELPLGVRIKILYKDGDKTLTLNRTVFLRTAVSLNQAKRKALSEKANALEAQSEQ